MFGTLTLLTHSEFVLLLTLGNALAYDQADFGSFENHIQAPHSSILTDIQTDERLLISGGPGRPHPNVTAAFQHPQLAMFEPLTMQMLEEIKHGLRYAFQTNNSHTLAITGTGMTAMETVLGNMVEEGDVFLIPINGMWSQRVRNISKRLGAKVVTIEKELGRTFSMEELEEAVKEHKPKLVYLAGGETTTGVFTRLDQIGEICNKYGCYTIADVCHIVGIQPLLMDKWKIDVAYSNAQKGIGSAVGLSLLSFSDRAVDKIMNRVKDNHSFLWDLRVWREYNYWLLNPAVPHQYLHSYPVLLFYSLREALNRLSKEGLAASWKKHYEANTFFRERLFAEFPQLQHYVEDPKARLTGAIFAKLPENAGVTPIQITTHMRQKYKIDGSVGLGPSWGKVIRFAFLGIAADIPTAERALKAIRETLINFNFKYVPYKDAA